MHKLLALIVIGAYALCSLGASPRVQFGRTLKMTFWRRVELMDVDMI